MADKEKDVIGRCTVKDVRLSFPFLFQKSPPRKRDDGSMDNGNYRASGIMYKSGGEHSIHTKSNLAILTQAKKDVLNAKYGLEKNWPKIKAEKICVRNGDLEDWDGYENSYYITASENEQPLLLTRRRDAKGLWIPAEPKDLYAGCYVNMIVQLWVQDNEHGKRVNANLKAVQFYAHGEGFSSSAPIDAAAAFGDIEEQDDGDIGSGFSGGDDDDDSVV